MTLGEFLDAAVTIAGEGEAVSVDAEGWKHSTGSVEINYRVYSAATRQSYHGSTPEKALDRFRQANEKSAPDGSLELSTEDKS